LGRQKTECHPKLHTDILSPKWFYRAWQCYDPHEILMARDFVPRDRLTDAAVARLLSVSKRTLLRWLKSGVIDPPILVVGKRRERRWAEHEVAQILDQMKKGDLSDPASDIESAGRRGENNHRRYFGTVLRRQRHESPAGGH
jgi:hypothetical protein